MKKSHQRPCVTDSQNRLIRMFIYNLPSTIYHSIYKLGLTFPAKLNIMVTEMALNLSFRMKILRLSLKDTEVKFFKTLNTFIISTPCCSQFKGIRNTFLRKVLLSLFCLPDTIYSQGRITLSLNSFLSIK